MRNCYSSTITIYDNRKIIEISKKERDINELRLKSITTKSQLASLTKRTEIEKIVREIKLFTSIEPNYILENAEK